MIKLVSKVWGTKYDRGAFGDWCPCDIELRPISGWNNNEIARGSQGRKHIKAGNLSVSSRNCSCRGEGDDRGEKSCEFEEHHVEAEKAIRILWRLFQMSQSFYMASGRNNQCWITPSLGCLWIQRQLWQSGCLIRKPRNNLQDEHFVYHAWPENQRYGAYSDTSIAALFDHNSRNGTLLHLWGRQLSWTFYSSDLKISEQPSRRTFVSIWESQGAPILARSLQRLQLNSAHMLLFGNAIEGAGQASNAAYGGPWPWDSEILILPPSCKWIKGQPQCRPSFFVPQSFPHIILYHYDYLMSVTIECWTSKFGDMSNGKSSNFNSVYPGTGNV